MELEWRGPPKSLGSRTPDLRPPTLMHEGTHQGHPKRPCDAGREGCGVVDSPPDAAKGWHRDGRHRVEGRITPDGSTLLGKQVAEGLGHGMPGTPLDPQEPPIERLGVRAEANHRLVRESPSAAVGTPARRTARCRPARSAAQAPASRGIRPPARGGKFVRGRRKLEPQKFPFDRPKGRSHRMHAKRIAPPERDSENPAEIPACRLSPGQRPAIFRSTAFRMPPLR